jgi:3-hydroxymyristoyl/3-hydroxydecanoyl-(acyl carrier protein) dehydratase
VSPPPPAAELESELAIASDHPAYAGHFPGQPILPGAVLLDEALREIGRSRGIDLTHWRLASAKFLKTVGPGEPLTLTHSAPSGSAIRFMICSSSRVIASGMLAYGD